MGERIYAAIDLKSFYASVECVERHLDPLTTHLVVADASRTAQTICLAVTPALKAYGVSGRPRLYEVIAQVRGINEVRRLRYGWPLRGESFDDTLLRRDNSLRLSYIVAPPHMAKYIEYSTRVYSIYLHYIAPEDIHVYSIDEVFLDLTPYLTLYKMTAEELTRLLLQEVLAQTGITATAGLGTNLYLSKVAMDVVAKAMAPDKYGMRFASLDEMSYRKLLWDHRPLTDFWRIGQGYARALAAKGIYTMGDIARCSLGSYCEFYNEELLYKLFGINAELLIDHAWGWENCTIAEIKAYQPRRKSLSSGQVLPRAYKYVEGELVVREMAELLALDAANQNLTAVRSTLIIGYDRSNISDCDSYEGDTHIDHYGRVVPAHGRGTQSLPIDATSSSIREAFVTIYRRVVSLRLSIRRILLTLECAPQQSISSAALNYVPQDLFVEKEKEQACAVKRTKEEALTQVTLALKQRFGKNAILKAMNLCPAARTPERNGEIGGHRA